MNRDDAIRQGLQAAGVPVQVYSTTLAKEGATDLRTLMASGRFSDPKNPQGVFVYPETRTLAAQARKVFGLLAKEMYLSGTSVCWLHTAVFLENPYSEGVQEIMEKANDAQAVFLVDFYEQGAKFPFSPVEATKLRYWIRRKFEAGSMVSFCSDTSFDKAAEWWPASFLEFVRGYTTDYVVKAPQA